MNLLINKAHYPVTVLGYGRRIGIWTQGCSIGCKGCISRDTWNVDPDKQIDVDSLVNWCRQVSGGDIDGVTISGGEPFDQPESLEAFLASLRAWIDTQQREIDILCYTGLPYKKAVAARYDNLRKYIDVLITDPFVVSLDGAPLRGSSNQRIVPLSPIGHLRYDGLSERESPPAKRIQITADPDHIWFVGIPEKDDMKHLEEICSKQGLEFGLSSWRA